MDTQQAQEIINEISRSAYIPSKWEKRILTGIKRRLDLGKTVLTVQESCLRSIRENSQQGSN